MQREKILEVLEEHMDEAEKYFTGDRKGLEDLRGCGRGDRDMMAAAQGYWAGLGIAEALLLDGEKELQTRNAFLEDGASEAVFNIVTGIALEMEV